MILKKCVIIVFIVFFPVHLLVAQEYPFLSKDTVIKKALDFQKLQQATSAYQQKQYSQTLYYLNMIEGNTSVIKEIHRLFLFLTHLHLRNYSTAEVFYLIAPKSLQTSYSLALLDFLKKHPQQTLKNIKYFYSTYPALQKETDFLQYYISHLNKEEHTSDYNQISKALWLNDGITNIKENTDKEFFNRYLHNLTTEEIKKYINRKCCRKNYTFYNRLYPKILKKYDSDIKNLSYFSYRYAQALIRTKKYSQALNVLNNKKIHNIRRIRSYIFTIYLIKKDTKAAHRHINKLIKEKANPKLINTLRYRFAKYHFDKQEYEQALYRYNKIKTFYVEKQLFETIQWEKYFSYYNLRHYNQARNILKWSFKHKFNSTLYGSYFCYWAIKHKNLQITPLPSTNHCISNYWNSYYGMKSLDFIQDTENLISIKNITYPTYSYKNDSLPLIFDSVWLQQIYQNFPKKLLKPFIYQLFKTKIPFDFFVHIIVPLLKDQQQYRLLIELTHRYYPHLLTPKSQFFSLALTFIYPLAYLQEFQQYAKKYQLETFFLLALSREESHFDKDASSVVGAIGLMQLMPATAKDIARRINIEEKLGFHDKNINIQMGSYYVSKLKKQFKGSLPLTLAAYNGGAKNVKQWIRKTRHQDIERFIETIPFRETKNYVKKVTRSYLLYKAFYE